MLGMTLEQLRVFVAVAERQHMTRAAAALNLAQSAASHAIAGLEGRYGTQLFDRVGRRIELTEAGRLFLGEARAVLARAAAAELALSELGGLERGTLRLKASQTIAGYWLPRFLVAFTAAHPAIDIDLAIGNTAEVAAAVAAGTVELGFVEGPVVNDDLLGTPVARDQLVVVVALGHPWAAQTDFDIGDLMAGEWVLREPGSGTRAAFEAALATFGRSPAKLRVRLLMPSNEAVCSAVEAGLGATAISASVAAPGIEAGLLHQIPFHLPERDFHLLRHRDRYRSRAAERLVALIGETVPYPRFVKV